MKFVVGKLYPKQIEYCKSINKYICYGGSRGGGKSHVSRIKAILLALNYPGIQILLLRRTLAELRENHVIQLQKILNCQKQNKIATFKDATKEFIFPNGSRIVLGYCDNEKDVLQYQGQAYEVIILEEATHFTEFQFEALTESNRLSGNMKVAFKPRMYFTCNPGGVGHAWVKRLFIDRDYNENENPDDYVFIPSNVFENEYLMENDPGYVKTLEALPEDRKQAMLYGNWDVYDGQYFPEFDRKIHVIEPFEIPNSWLKYAALDYGLDMFAVTFHAIDTEFNDYVYNEIHKTNLIVSEAANELKNNPDFKKLKNIFAPPDLWNRRNDSGKSAEEIFYDNGVTLDKCSNDRKAGWLAVKEWIKPIIKRDAETGKEYKTSKLRIFNNCVNLIRCLPQLQHDDKDPNDVATQPHEITHITDSLRHFCISRTMPTAQPIKIKETHFNFNSEKPQQADYGEQIVIV